MTNISYEDMYHAYLCCRKRKKNTKSSKEFDTKALFNIIEITDEINKREYVLKKSKCFVVEYPVAREVFCAEFRDRIVQHFVYNELNDIVEKKLIRNTMSCRKKKGTDKAILMVERYLRMATDNYTKDVSIAKLDLSGFFSNIDRNILYDILKDIIIIEYRGKYQDALLYLVKIIALDDVAKNSVIICKKEKLKLIKKEKSLFYKDTGLAIGNITSQLFANLYLNSFDHLMKSRHKYFVRYVDDMIIIDDKEKLVETISIANEFLKSYNQKLNMKKSIIRNSRYGVTFLGIKINYHYSILSKSRINRLYFTSKV